VGTWGTGNFDNDAALDYVHDLLDELIERINSCFEGDGADLDEGGESRLIPSVFMITLL
jgi:hypothetical protein